MNTPIDQEEPLPLVGWRLALAQIVAALAFGVAATIIVTAVTWMIVNPT